MRDYLIDPDFHLKKIKPKFRKMFELALPFLNTRHNEVHTFIVYQYALLLLEEEPGAPEVAIPAAILHDVGWSSVPEERQLDAFGPNMTDQKLRRKHEVEGAAIAREILVQSGYDPEFIPEIVAIVGGHDTTPGANSLEDAITKDADKLFRFSNAGFTIDRQRFNDEPLSSVQFLVERIDQWFLTKTGKEIARHEAHMREKEIVSF